MSKQSNQSGDEGVAAEFGDHMKVKLSDDDRRAVDMLLDRQVTGGNGGNTPASAAGDFQKRLGRVEAILQLLSETPAADPPADLVQRVMHRIDETPRHLGTPAESTQATIDSTHPHA